MIFLCPRKISIQAKSSETAPFGDDTRFDTDDVTGSYDAYISMSLPEIPGTEFSAMTKKRNQVLLSDSSSMMDQPTTFRIAAFVSMVIVERYINLVLDLNSFKFIWTD